MSYPLPQNINPITQQAYKNDEYTTSELIELLIQNNTIPLNLTNVNIERINFNYVADLISTCGTFYYNFQTYVGQFLMALVNTPHPTDNNLFFHLFKNNLSPLGKNPGSDSAVFKINNLLAVKVGPLDSILSEAYIGLKLNKIRHKTNTFITTYGMIYCGNPYENHNWCNTVRDRPYILLENIPHSYPLDEIGMALNIEQCTSIIIQVINALNIAHRDLNIVHGDIVNGNNVQVQFLLQSVEVPIYIGDKVYYHQTKVLARIIDFGLSYETFEDGRKHIVGSTAINHDFHQLLECIHTQLKPPIKLEKWKFVDYYHPLDLYNAFLVDYIGDCIFETQSNNHTTVNNNHTTVNDFFKLICEEYAYVPIININTNPTLNFKVNRYTGNASIDDIRSPLIAHFKAVKTNADVRHKFPLTNNNPIASHGFIFESFDIYYLSDFIGSCDIITSDRYLSIAVITNITGTILDKLGMRTVIAALNNKNINMVLIPYFEDKKDEYNIFSILRCDLTQCLDPLFPPEQFIRAVFGQIPYFVEYLYFSPVKFTAKDVVTFSKSITVGSSIIGVINGMNLRIPWHSTFYNNFREYLQNYKIIYNFVSSNMGIYSVSFPQGESGDINTLIEHDNIEVIRTRRNSTSYSFKYVIDSKLTVFGNFRKNEGGEYNIAGIILLFDAQHKFYAVEASRVRYNIKPIYYVPKLVYNLFNEFSGAALW